MILKHSLVKPEERVFKKSTTLDNWNKKWIETRKEFIEAGAIQKADDLITPPYAYGPTAIFCASKQMKMMAMCVFYGDNTFSFTSIDHMQQYLSSITQLARSCIRHVALEFRGNIMVRKHGLQMLTTCDGLHSLKLIISQESTVGARRTHRFPHLDTSLTSLRGISWILSIRGLRALEIVYREEAGRYIRVNDRDREDFRIYLLNTVTRAKAVPKPKKNPKERRDL
jgi:hypothetical protein